MTTYTESTKKAIYKHRDANRDEYNERQRNYYHKIKENPEWKENYNIRCREANKKYRDKKLLESGVEKKPRGRPRKITIEAELELEEVIF
jgi:hypothetical protein